MFALSRPELRLPPRFERRLGPPVGVLTGFFNGLTGSQVMPVLPYMLSLRLTPAEFVQATNIGFTASSFVMMAGLARLGLVDTVPLLLSVVGVLPVVLGIHLGARLRRRFTHGAFRQAVLLLMLVLGFNLSIRLAV